LRIEAPPNPPAMEQCSSADTVFRQATTLAEDGHFGRAAELFQKASQLDPSSAKHYEARAQCLMELGQFQGAVASAEQAVKLSADWLPGKATLGRALFNAGQLEDAVGQFEEALKLAENDPEWAAELRAELVEFTSLLHRHWAEHHDILLPVRAGLQLRIRQALNCRYCRLSNAELGPGGAVWAAGCILATQATSILAALPPRPRILELGSGTGAAGLAAAAVGAEVVLTDHSNLLSLIQLNMQMNADFIQSAGGSASSCAFDWEEKPADELLQRRFDLAIGADLVYSFAAVEPFTIALQAVLLPQAAEGRTQALAPSMLYAHFPRFPDLDKAMTTALATKGLVLQERALPPWKGNVGSIPEDALCHVKLLEIRPGTPSTSCAGSEGQQDQHGGEHAWDYHDMDCDCGQEHWHCQPAAQPHGERHERGEHWHCQPAAQPHGERHERGHGQGHGYGELDASTRTECRCMLLGHPDKAG